MANKKHDWAALVEAHARSGLTQKAFCAKRGIHPVTFCQERCKRRQAPKRRQVGGTRSAFVRARLASASPTGRLELSLGVMTLRFEAETSPAYIAALVQALS
jgi:hypothetical protein